MGAVGRDNGRDVAPGVEPVEVKRRDRSAQSVGALDTPDDPFGVESPTRPRAPGRDRTGRTLDVPQAGDLAPDGRPAQDGRAGGQARAAQFQVGLEVAGNAGCANRVDPADVRGDYLLFIRVDVKQLNHGQAHDRRPADKIEILGSAEGQPRCPRVDRATEPHRTGADHVPKRCPVDLAGDHQTSIQIDLGGIQFVQVARDLYSLNAGPAVAIAIGKDYEPAVPCGTCHSDALDVSIAADEHLASALARKQQRYLRAIAVDDHGRRAGTKCEVRYSRYGSLESYRRPDDIAGRAGGLDDEEVNGVGSAIRRVRGHSTDQIDGAILGRDSHDKVCRIDHNAAIAEDYVLEVLKTRIRSIDCDVAELRIKPAGDCHRQGHIKSPSNMRGVSIRLTIRDILARPDANGIVTGAACNHVRTRAAIERILAVLTVEFVVMTSTKQCVIARAAGQRVTPVIAGDRIIARRAHNVVHPAQYVGVAISVIGRFVLGQIDCHGARRCGVVGRVGAHTTVEKIITGVARQRIIARAAIETIITRTAR